MRVFFFLLTFFMLLAPTLALAAELAAKQTWWEHLLLTLIQIVLLIGLPTLVVLISKVLSRFNINVESEQLTKIAQQASNWAEHKAKIALKDSGEKTEGAQKMELALGFAKGMAEQYKLPEKAQAKMKDLIEAAVSEKEKPTEV